ncbi:hypothetical protein [Spirillospora sp. CA-294931]|uniref:hypothetical protein n=1 Tax=Spirillospora sp. CA-294931 TaxID=3240042 RepID=UPI003D8C5AE4
MTVAAGPKFLGTSPRAPGPAATHDGARLAYRFVVGVDVEGFSGLSTLDQIRIQEDLGDALNIAAVRTGLDRSTWYRQVAGDGELAFLPADTDGLSLVAAYPLKMAEALREVNDRRAPRPPVRVRLAMHHGTLVAGCFGPVGEAPIVVRRLLDSQILHDELRVTEKDLALVVSESIFGGVVKTQLDGLEPSAFHPVEIQVQNTTYIGYIHRDARDNGLGSLQWAPKWPLRWSTLRNSLRPGRR